jgi:Mg2+ and Co2+ transporter CorA
LPLDEHPAAFIFVLALMFAIAALMLAYFRHRHWL